MIKGITVEICAGSIEDVITADRFPDVDRIEFNSALELGGLTSGIASFTAARRITDKKILCMCRPRPAGFCYSPEEKEVLYEEAVRFLENGADGIVFGCLTPGAEIDEEFTKKTASLAHAYGKEAVFHKAFDETPDLLRSAETLIRCGIDRILTSGGAPDVMLGIETIASLQKTYGKRIGILPGSGVSEANAADILRLSGCTQLHMSAKEVRMDRGPYFAASPLRIQKILRVLNDSLTA